MKHIIFILLLLIGYHKVHGQLSVFAGTQVSSFTGEPGLFDKNYIIILNPVVGMGYNIPIGKFEKYKPGILIKGYYNSFSSAITDHYIDYEYKFHHSTFIVGPSFTINWNDKSRSRIASTLALSHILRSEVKLDYISDQRTDLRLNLNGQKDNMRLNNLAFYLEIGHDIKKHKRFKGISLYSVIFNESFFKYNLINHKYLVKHKPFAIGLKLSFFLNK